MEREPGYYWVRMFGEDWRIAQWLEGCWLATGSEHVGHLYDEIDERRLVRTP